MENLVNITLHNTGTSSAIDALGMRPMQARVYKSVNQQYLLVKSPPASGKSRAAMFVSLKKLADGIVRKVIIAVPERSIGKSFADTDLMKYGFFANWSVSQGYNLCVPGGEAGKVNIFKKFFNDEKATVLVCTHATLRAAFNKIGISPFNNTFVVIDEFHHVSQDVDNRLGELVRALISEGSVHIMAMTGSYFRGDRVPVMAPEDESKFSTVVYNYYEQMDGYKYLKNIRIESAFYSTEYFAAIPEVLDTDKKTILYIPSVNSGESTKDKYTETDRILDSIGSVIKVDSDTGVIVVDRASDHKKIRVADLVNDTPKDREKIMAYLQSDEENEIDLIIALGMAKEGFDWPPCEHVIVVGTRNSLTEIVQIIGRCTRDYKGKTSATYTNLVAVPDAGREEVVTAVNNITKAIVASLLMEQVLQPNYKFRRKTDSTEPISDNAISIDGLREPSTARVKSIIETDMPEVQEAILQNPMVQKAIANVMDGMGIDPQTFNKILIPKVIIEKYPDLTDEEREELREQAVAGLVLRNSKMEKDRDGNICFKLRTGPEQLAKVINVEHINMDLIDSVNPFMDQYEILSKNFTPKMLKSIRECIATYKIDMSDEEAYLLWPEINNFYRVLKREPDIDAIDPREKRLAEALLYLRRAKREHENGKK